MGFQETEGQGEYDLFVVIEYEVQVYFSIVRPGRLLASEQH